MGNPPLRHMYGGLYIGIAQFDYNMVNSYPYIHHSLNHWGFLLCIFQSHSSKTEPCLDSIIIARVRLFNTPLWRIPHIRHLYGEFYIGIAQCDSNVEITPLHTWYIYFWTNCFPFSQFENWTLFRLDNTNRMILSIQCAVVVYPPSRHLFLWNCTSALHNVVIL